MSRINDVMAIVPWTTYIQRSMSIAPEGVKALSEGLKENTTLKTLDLTSNSNSYSLEIQ